MALFEVAERLARGYIEHLNLPCAWQEGANGHAAFACMRPEHRERIAVAAGANQFDIVGIQHVTSFSEAQPAQCSISRWRIP